MKYKVVAFDYDGTLADEGMVTDEVIECLEKLRASGRKLLLVSGRLLDDLRRVFPQQNQLFDAVVAENGAIAYYPPTDTERLLTQPADLLLVEELSERGVDPLVVGRCIISTYANQEAVLSEVLRDLSLEYSIVLNKEHAMLLPNAVNKASGMLAVLKEMRINSNHVVAFGDAENDEAMLAAAGFGVAVQNSVPALKVIASLVTSGARGFGVIEGIDHLLRNEFFGI
jgi:HAD superfamily hydrolase (TIGR01484 family)